MAGGDRAPPGRGLRQQRTPGAPTPPGRCGGSTLGPTGRELHDVTLAAYLAELHDAGRASSSASMAVAAACFRAKLAGQPAPADERTARVARRVPASPPPIGGGGQAPCPMNPARTPPHRLVRPFIEIASARGSRLRPASGRRPTPPSRRLQATPAPRLFGRGRRAGPQGVPSRGAGTRTGTAASRRPRGARSRAKPNSSPVQVVPERANENAVAAALRPSPPSPPPDSAAGGLDPPAPGLDRRGRHGRTSAAAPSKAAAAARRARISAAVRFQAAPRSTAKRTRRRRLMSRVPGLRQSLATPGCSSSSATGRVPW